MLDRGTMYWKSTHTQMCTVNNETYKTIYNTGYGSEECLPTNSLYEAQIGSGLQEKKHLPKITYDAIRLKLKLYS